MSYILSSSRNPGLSSGVSLPSTERKGLVMLIISAIIVNSLPAPIHTKTYRAYSTIIPYVATRMVSSELAQNKLANASFIIGCVTLEYIKFSQPRDDWGFVYSAFYGVGLILACATSAYMYRAQREAGRG